MNVLIIDIDSRIPNFALRKVEAYHLRQGDDVKWNLPLWRQWADEIYVSCVFERNKHLCREWEGSATIGGSGYDLVVKLPPEIESIKPRINLGFTTRGCIRECGFCIVPKKEGRIRAVGDLLDLWDGESTDVMVLDNNILALPDHFRIICEQARTHSIRVDFNQGLDHRLLTEDMCRLLKSIRHKEYRFAFDSIDQYDSVAKAIRLLKQAGINRCFWYVLVGYNTAFRDDLSRLEYLKMKGQTAFVQRYTKSKGNLLLGKWVNRHNIFRALSFKEFLDAPVNAKYVEKYAEEVFAYIESEYIAKRRVGAVLHSQQMELFDQAVGSD